ncbi:hypothetical protein [Emergencia sp. 1XD21-10]|uniref:hypothetical protein n=1 Tax=Emergencia sp. 1XD21-10 TaxID=2304569 RepID=UPI00137A5A72|nr:hypothetical protein [Emergencia sp. 1XD21-10]NCE98098.1 hypothetical protein [Emergencia sp. 1XD21-10]
MFLTEKELRDKFWENYNYNHRAVRYQFEAPVRTGSIDLLTIEKFQENFQINAFEFKLDDIKKVILQAKGNLKYCNKSWIVVPAEKENLIMGRYKNILDDAKYVGVITVEEGGRWNPVYRPQFQKEIPLTQHLLNFIMREVAAK